ncbi:MAG: flippase-like domain-containing protein [Bacteroidetes bacterium]|nr:flippase-like domain-containing protein [Bacteroidota bacterium]
MQNYDKILRRIKPRQIVLPIVIGFAVVLYLFWNDFSHQSFSDIQFTRYAVVWLAVACFMMFLRDFGYVLRLRILSEGSLTWVQCIRIIFLWEFTSAVTPAAVGGTSVAVLFIYKEGIPLGKGTAMVLATAFLDELYFLIMFPAIVLSVSFSELFSVNSQLLGTTADASIVSKLVYFAIIGYVLKAIFVCFVFYGLFINPRGFKRLLGHLFSIKFLKRWRKSAIRTGSDMMIASAEYKRKSLWFWLRAFASTAISWTARYWVVNFLFLAFFVVPDHLLLFARQLVMWIMMLVMPTPGGSGFAEIIFSDYLGEFIPVVALIPVLTVLWRLITYYPYLFAGAIYVPIWIKKRFLAHEK